MSVRSGKRAAPFFEATSPEGGGCRAKVMAAASHALPGNGRGGIGCTAMRIHLLAN